MIPMNRLFVQSVNSFSQRSCTISHSVILFNARKFASTTQENLSYNPNKRIGFLLMDDSKQASEQATRLSKILGNGPIIGKHESSKQ